MDFLINMILTSVNELTINPYALVFIKLVIIILFVIISVKFFDRLSRIFVNKFSEYKHVNKIKTLTKICKIILYTIIGFIATALFLKYILLIDISSMLTLASIAGIIIGYAAQKIIQDFINGVMLLLEESITLNDDVEVNGCRGIIEDINLHCIYLRDKNNVLHVIPCSQITNGYTNYTRQEGK